MKKLLFLTFVFTFSAVNAANETLKNGIIHSDYQEVIQNMDITISAQEKGTLISLAHDVLRKREMDLTNDWFKVYCRKSVIIPGLLHWLFSGMHADAVRILRRWENDPEMIKKLTGSSPQELKALQAFYFSAGAAFLIGGIIGIYRGNRAYHSLHHKVEEAQRIKSLLLSEL